MPTDLGAELQKRSAVSRHLRAQVGQPDPPGLAPEKFTISEEDKAEVTESVIALAGTTHASRYCNSSFRLLAGQFWQGNLG